MSEKIVLENLLIAGAYEELLYIDILGDVIYQQIQNNHNIANRLDNLMNKLKGLDEARVKINAISKDYFKVNGTGISGIEARDYIIKGIESDMLAILKEIQNVKNSLPIVGPGYSDNDMVEFAKYAKSYQSSKDVEKALIKYKDGNRIITKSKDL